MAENKEPTQKLPSFAEQDTSGLPQAVAERLQQVDGYLPGQLAQVKASLRKLDPVFNAVIHFVSDGAKGTSRQRIVSLRNLTGQISKEASSLTACRKGCSDCCHIPVALNRIEAQVIGAAIGVKPAEVQPREALDPSYGYDRPCTFLEEGRCSIYEHRPMSCRTLVNLDKDELLCRLLPDKTVPVPYLDMTSLQMLYVIGSEGSPLGDIRDFFPQGRGKSAHRGP